MRWGQLRERERAGEIESLKTHLPVNQTNNWLELLLIAFAWWWLGPWTERPEKAKRNQGTKRDTYTYTYTYNGYNATQLLLLSGKLSEKKQLNRCVLLFLSFSNFYYTFHLLNHKQQQNDSRKKFKFNLWTELTQPTEPAVAAGTTLDRIKERRQLLVFVSLFVSCHL